LCLVCVRGGEDMPPDNLSDVVTFLREQVMKRIGISDVDLDNDAPLAELGVTSLDAALITGELEEHFDMDIDPTTMFECRTIRAVAENVASFAKS
jgi:acyl carrier protein